MTRDCDHCGQPADEWQSVETCPRSPSGPAEYEDWCPRCVQRRRPPSRQERLQAAADAGHDTWDEWRGDN